MKRTILVLGVVMALVAAMALPMAVLAATDTTALTGTLGQTFVLTAPSPFGLGIGGVAGSFALGTNTGSSAAPGSVVTNAKSWTLTVADAKTLTKGYMTSGGDVVASELTNAILVGTTAGTVDVITAPTSVYQTALQAAAGYGAPGNTYSIPLFAKQVVAPGDVNGSYSITLTYTVTPTY